MADDSAQEDRTEPATPKRLSRAREEGNVPVSKELPVLAGLAAVTLTLAMTGGDVAQHLALRLSLFLTHARAPDLVGMEGFRQAYGALLRAAAPFVLAALAAGIFAVLLQTGFLIRGAALKPKLSKLNPGAGFGRLFSSDSTVEAVKSLCKMVVLAAVTWHVLRNDLAALTLAPRWTTPTLLAATTDMVLRLLMGVLATQTLIAAGDFLWVRFSFARRMRMTRQDIRDEQKEAEGDPKIKARIRQIRMQRARRRMLAAVPNATVVVTNPTHYAVALSYDRARNAAPRVVAKGVDTLAARIREVAEANRVPLVANPPLARALYRVELDAEIPAEHFQAMAEIIAYVWKLGHRARHTAPAAQNMRQSAAAP